MEDVRDSDYFTLDELDKIKEIFGDEISYIDSYASVNSEVLAGRTNMKFDFQGIDWNFSDVQPVTMISGRYLNEGDILGRKKNVVIEEESARKLFGTENAVGKTFPDHRLRGYRHVYGSRCLQKRDERLQKLCPEVPAIRGRVYRITLLTGRMTCSITVVCTRKRERTW